MYENVGHITAGSSSQESLSSSDKSFRVLNSFRVEEQRIFFLSPSTFLKYIFYAFDVDSGTGWLHFSQMSGDVTPNLDTVLTFNLLPFGTEAVKLSS